MAVLKGLCANAMVLFDGKNYVRAVKTVKKAAIAVRHLRVATKAAVIRQQYAKSQLLFGCNLQRM